MKKVLFILGLVSIMFSACSEHSAACRTGLKKHKYFNSLQFGAAATAKPVKKTSYKKKH